MGNMTVTQQVAGRIKRLRLQRGWTAQQLAEELARAGRASLTRSTIAKIESGVRKSVTADELAALAQVLDVTLSDLMITDGNDVVSDKSMELRGPSQIELRAKVYNLPRRPTSVFTGRDIIQALLEKVSASRNAIIGQVICGLAGVGKSELALQYAFSRLDRYSVVWWISADSIERIQAGLAGLAGRIYPPIQLAGSVENAAYWAVGWLQTHSGWLLVLDNVEDPDHVRSLLGQLSGGHVIITTRRNIYWGGGVQSIVLDVLDPTSSAELIFKIIGDDRGGGDKVAVAELAAELGFLPLALKQAAGYIIQNRISVERYLARLREHPLQMYGRMAEGGQFQNTISRLWKIVLETIGRRSPESIELLHTLACYDSSDIPRQIVPESLNSTYLDEALGLLASYSVLTLTEDAVSMHRLTRAVVLAEIENNLEESHSAQNTALEWIIAALPENPEYNLTGWPLWRRLMPHIYALADRFLKGSEPIGLLDVLNQAAVFQSAQGAYRSAATLAAHALAIAEAAYGPDHPDVAFSLGNLASSVRALGRPGEAVPLFERALAIAEAAYGPDHPTIAIRLGNLAVSFRDLEQSHKAVPLLERALAIAEAAYGLDHPIIASLQNVLSSQGTPDGSISPEHARNDQEGLITLHAVSPGQSGNIAKR